MQNDYSRYLPEVDVNDGLTRIMNNKKLYLSLLRKFNVREMSEKLLGFMTGGGDAAQAAAAAHAIKGAASNLGVILLYQVTMEIENAAKAGGDFTCYAQKLSETFEATENAINTLLKEENA